MSELQNPLFDEEKEFLERKKLEYERALRGDVDHIKDQSVKVGKLALVGAGLAGGIWLITKAFSGKSKNKKRKRHTSEDRGTDSNHHEPDNDYEFGVEYFTAANGHRYQADAPPKSAAESAKVFASHHEHLHDGDDLGFGAPRAAEATDEPAMDSYHQPAASDFDSEAFEDDPFQDLPYDDSRRLPTSHAFDGDETSAARATNSRSRMIGSVLQAFLQSDTGKVLVGQVAAVALALVTKKVSEFFPADKNSDLATPADPAMAAAGYSPVASSASSVPSDASTQPQSL